MRSILTLLALICDPSVAAQTVVQPPVTANAAAPAYKENFWYPSLQGVTAGGGAIVTGNLRLMAVSITKPITIDKLGAVVSTLAATGNATLHFYPNAIINRPTGSSVSCTITTATTGTKTCDLASAVSITTPGVYWFGIEVDSAASNAAAFQTFATSTNNNPYIAGMSAFTLPISSSSKVAISWTHSYGSSSDLTGGTLVEYQANSDALVYFHVSSIP